MYNTNENIANYKYDNSQLVEVTVNNNGNNIVFSNGGSGGGSGTFGTKTVTSNGIYTAADDSLDGYSSITVNLPNSRFRKRTANVTASAVLTPGSGYNGISQAEVTVPTEITQEQITILNGLPVSTDKSNTSVVQLQYDKNTARSYLVVSNINKPCFIELGFVSGASGNNYGSFRTKGILTADQSFSTTISVGLNRNNPDNVKLTAALQTFLAIYNPERTQLLGFYLNKYNSGESLLPYTI